MTKWGDGLLSKLFFDEQPIVVSRELAKLVGLNEAIVLQQVHYWIEINRKANKNYYEGKYWTYNSIRAWHEENFDFWSLNTVQRTFSKLESVGLLLSANFNKDPRDKTKWYSINLEAINELEKSIALKPKSTENLVKSIDSSITPKWGNALVQNEVMHYSKMGQPLPEITTEIIKDINNQSVSLNNRLIEFSEKEIKTDGQTEDIDLITAVLKKRIAYDEVVRVSTDIGLVEDIFFNMLEMYFGNGISVAGVKRSQDMVRSAIMRLDYFKVLALIEKYNNITTEIKNYKAYLQTMIYNMAFESELAIVNQVKNLSNFS